MHRSLLALALLLTTAGGLRAERPGTSPAGIVPPQAPKSTFQDEPGFGRDPFFPNSQRRGKVVQNPDTDHARPNVPDFISLKGISLIQGRKLAIINNYTVAEGEEFSLRYGAQSVKVKCLEIKERLVVIQVNGGVTKELPLRSGF